MGKFVQKVKQKYLVYLQSFKTYDDTVETS